MERSFCGCHYTTFFDEILYSHGTCTNTKWKVVRKIANEILDTDVPYITVPQMKGRDSHLQGTGPQFLMHKNQTNCIYARAYGHHGPKI